jgi:hypothetical protein
VVRFGVGVAISPVVVSVVTFALGIEGSVVVCGFGFVDRVLELRLVGAVLLFCVVVLELEF